MAALLPPRARLALPISAPLAVVSSAAFYVVVALVLWAASVRLAVVPTATAAALTTLGGATVSAARAPRPGARRCLAYPSPRSIGMAAAALAAAGMLAGAWLWLSREAPRSPSVAYSQFSWRKARLESRATGELDLYVRNATVGARRYVVRAQADAVMPWAAAAFKLAPGAVWNLRLRGPVRRSACRHYITATLSYAATGEAVGTIAAWVAPRACPTIATAR